MIPESKWKWLGHAGHFILGDKCVFHLNTEIGYFRVSTIGELKEDTKKAGQFAFGGKKYETMVFKLSKKVCSCGCGEKLTEDWSEVYCKRYDTCKQAYEGHIKACLQYAKKGKLTKQKKPDNERLQPENIAYIGKVE